MCRHHERYRVTQLNCIKHNTTTILSSVYMHKCNKQTNTQKMQKMSGKIRYVFASMLCDDFIEKVVALCSRKKDAH